VTIDGVEQNDIRFDWLFRMFEVSRPEHVGVNETATTLEYEGLHHGYERLSAPVTHSRRFTLERTSDRLRVRDTFAGTGRHTLVWNFCCAPGVTPAVTSAGVEIASAKVRARLSVPAGVQVSVVDASYSPSYGVISPARAVVMRADVELNGPAEYLFELVPQ